jgi:hypothetical protein
MRGPGGALRRAVFHGFADGHRKFVIVARSSTRGPGKGHPGTHGARRHGPTECPFGAASAIVARCYHELTN